MTETTTVQEWAREYDDARFEEWLRTGVEAGWIAYPDCQTHNPTPMTEAEEQELEDGFDPCIVVARVWKYCD